MVSPLDIIVVNDCAHVRGGSDQVALASARGLAAAGHRVTLFTAVGPIAAELVDHPALEVICLDTADILRDGNRLRAATRGLWNQPAASAFEKILHQFDPARTIVHVHGYTKALTAAVPLMATRLGYQTVLTLHDYFLGCPNGALFEYRTMEVCTRSPLSGACLACNCDARRYAHKLWRYARTWMQNEVGDLPGKLACVIALSHTNREAARNFLPRHTPVEIVFNPVDAAETPAVKVAQNDAFLFVGRLETYKGPLLLAQAATQLDARVIFCGTGPAADAIQSFCPSAELTGWQDRAALRHQFGRARALVFPSQWPETFGLTALEALARGVPVIASRGTAAEEWVQHGVNGFLFERGSVASLAEMMRELSNPRVAEKLGAEAYRRYWSNPLSLERHVASLITLFRSVLLPKTIAA